MPRAKSLNHYPTRYGEIVEAAAVRNEQVDVTLPTVEACRKLRGHYYAYKGALMRQAELLAARPIRTGGEQEVIERAHQSEMVILTILDNPPTVRFGNRESSWQAQALSGAVTTQGTSKPTTTGLDEIAARLLKIAPEGETNDH